MESSSTQGEPCPKGKLSDKLAEGLKVKDARTPLFYLLPKIHKEGHPGRPVISSINCHTAKISEFVDYQLQPFVQTLTSYVKDTTDFLNKIKMALVGAFIGKFLKSQLESILILLFNAQD